jgi:uncharacterized protein YhfF
MMTRTIAALRDEMDNKSDPMATETSKPNPSIAELSAQLEARGVRVPAGARAFMFGNTPALARELADLVLDGKKRATASLPFMWEGEGESLPSVGDVYVLHDWNGNAVALLRNTRVDVVPFDEVTEDFVRTEGEGDLTLAWWRDAHWQYFAEELCAIGQHPTRKMLVVCQRFDVLCPRTG